MKRHDEVLKHSGNKYTILLSEYFGNGFGRVEPPSSRHLDFGGHNLMILGFVYVALITGGLYLLGRYLVTGEVRRLGKRRENAIEFLNHLNRTLEKVNRRDDHSEDYTWLLLHVDTLDREMGAYAIIGWKPPMMPLNYSQPANVLRQGLSEIGRLDGRMGFLSDDNFWPQQMASAILQYIGYLENRIERRVENLSTFFVILARGIRYALTFPVRLFQWSGLISERSFAKFEDGPLGSLLSGIGLLAGILASIVTILQKWDEIIKLIAK